MRECVSRICRAGIKIPAVEVRFKDLSIDTKVNVS